MTDIKAWPATPGTLESYDDFVAAYGGEDNGLKHCVKRLQDEVTEVTETFWKGTDVELMMEFGDVLFFITRGARSMGYSLDDVIQGNVLKLTHRTQYGKNKEKEYDIVRDYLQGK